MTDYELISEMMNTKTSIMDVLDMDPEDLYSDEEYRDEREDSSRLAARHHC